MSSSSIIKVPKFMEAKKVVGTKAPMASADQVSLSLVSESGSIEVSNLGGLHENTPQQAQKLLDEVRIQAENILEQARNEAGQIQEVAYQTGLREGWEAGHLEGLTRGIEAGKKELATDAKTLKLMVEEALEAKAEILRNAELEMVRLVMDVAKKVIRQELSSNPAVVAKVVTSATQKVTEWDIVKIRVNPDDFELLNQYWSGENEEGHMGTWEIVADKRVKTGGCIIDTKSGIVDAQIDTQLAEIKKSFEALAEAGSN